MMIEAFAIINIDPKIPISGIIWGIGGIGCRTLAIFSTKAQAEFFMNLPEHQAEVKRETTRIVKVQINYIIEI